VFRLQYPETDVATAALCRLEEEEDDDDAVEDAEDSPLEFVDEVDEADDVASDELLHEMPDDESIASPANTVVIVLDVVLLFVFFVPILSMFFSCVSW
jgi:hypothetical protein